MSVTLTLRGESLMARLQAEGKVLDIDTFLFAHVEGLDPTAPASPAAEIPAKVVFRTSIPDEFKAYVTPNQVVYSALLGSDVGDFEFNWQGLYCSEHDTLVAYSTLPTLKKRAYNPATNTAGNNLNRNFILSYSGIQELTNITISPKTWQLDFTIRHKGIDERERLSNRDIYHRSSFFDDGWKLVKEGAVYVLKKGVGYVEGIRVALNADTPIAIPQTLPCDVYLDVCMEPEGSDVVTKVEPVFGAEGQGLGDYTSPAPFTVRHYVEKVSHVDSDGNVIDERSIPIDISGLVPIVRKIETELPLKGGGDLSNDLTLTVNMATDDNVKSRQGEGLVKAGQLELLGNKRIFFSQVSGSFTVPEGIVSLVVAITGGGGSGALAKAMLEATGGGAGATAIGVLSVKPGESVPYVIGAGGAAPLVPGTHGVAGGTSSCGELMATGGRGGHGVASEFAAGATPGGTATGGMINLAGNPSEPTNNYVAAHYAAGNGGASIWGGAGCGTSNYPWRGMTQEYIHARGPGSGGGAGTPNNNNDQLGAGNGADGCIVILY